MLSRLSRKLLLAFAVLGPAMCAPAWPQAHEQERGGYTLRASTTGSNNLSAATARDYGIVRSATRGVINVTVSKRGRTVPASIRVEARNLTGSSRPIRMRQTVANGYISYTGTYEFVDGEVLDFVIRAQPGRSKEALGLNFRDRMWRQGD